MRRREPDTPRGATARTALRASISVVVLVLLYYNLPLQPPHSSSDLLRISLCTAAFGAITAMEVRGVSRSRYPALRAIEALTVIIPLFICAFAALYVVMSTDHPTDFSSSLTRTDALYFTVTVFSTVGFGDIVAKSEGARIAVTLQMLGDLVVIGALARVIVSIAQRRRTALVHSSNDLEG